MKQFWKEFLKRGMLCCWGGPMVLAVIYACFDSSTVLNAAEAAKGIVTVTALAFVAAGITAIYQWEKIPLFPALLLHGAVLYAAYLAVYLANGWLAAGRTPFLVFTGAFIGGYAVIWAVIYFAAIKKATVLNRYIKKTAG